MALQLASYDREKAVQYANQWAYRRNPRFYDFSSIGGDCTNFASQCLYAGGQVMNYTPVYGWYYINLNNRAPAWTSVVYFHRFITTNQGVGPFGRDVSIEAVEPGDFVQIQFAGNPDFSHTPIITELTGPPDPEHILVAAHSNDVNCRPLSTYRSVARFRYIHIDGIRYETDE